MMRNGAPTVPRVPLARVPSCPGGQMPGWTDARVGQMPCRTDARVPSCPGDICQGAPQGLGAHKG